MILQDWIKQNVKWIVTGASAIIMSYTGFRLAWGYVDSRGRAKRQHKVDLLLRNVPHQNSQQSLKQLLDICIKIYLHEYSIGLSNHLPMVLIAIHELFTRYPVTNDSDEEIVSMMKKFFVSYEPRLKIVLSGDYKYDASQNVLFEDCELDKMIAGISGGSCHPFIQYAYSIIANHEETRKDAIHYMQIAFQSLERPSKVTTSPVIQKKIEQFKSEFYNSIEDFDAIQILNGLRKTFGPHIKLWTGEALISKKLLSVATGSPIYQEIQSITFPHLSQKIDIAYILEKLTACTLYMLVEYGSHDIAVLHCVTVTHAARIVLEGHRLSSEDKEWKLLHHVWQIVLATYMYNNMPYTIREHDVLESKGISNKSQIPEWEQIIPKLKNMGDRSDYEHDIKLIFTCADQARAFPQYEHIFRYVAAVRLFRGAPI